MEGGALQGVTDPLPWCSYSMTWWSWDRWQQELDLMALNGINLALAFTGQELAAQRAFARFDLTEQARSGSHASA